MTLSAFHWREQRAEADEVKTRTPGPGRGVKRPVEQLTLEGVFIRQFPSLREAGESIGQHDSNIHRVLTGIRKSCGGYRWRYVSREEQVLSTAPHGGAYSKA